MFTDKVMATMGNVTHAQSIISEGQHQAPEVTALQANPAYVTHTRAGHEYEMIDDVRERQQIHDVTEECAHSRLTPPLQRR